MNTPSSDQFDRFAQTLGNELTIARKQRGWTRKQMRAHLAGYDEDEVSLQTVATYELGTRRISVERLVDLCAVLDQRPDKLLLRAITGALDVNYDDRVEVDLSALARTSDPRLQHLRRWAVVRARQRPAHQPAVEEIRGARSRRTGEGRRNHQLPPRASPARSGTRIERMTG
jgi:transcriptional regulator with XRE-family HTH domain